MALAFRTPGVYREEIFARTPVALPTGVAGFVGFGQTRSGAPEALNGVAELSSLWTPPSDGSTFVPAAVAGFFANGGVRCHVVGAGPSAGGADQLEKALGALGPVTELDLVAIPDAMTLADPGDRLGTQKAAIAHCAGQGDRFAILDAPLQRDLAGDVATGLVAWRNSLVNGGVGAQGGSSNVVDSISMASLYFPWVVPAGATQPVPPSGHVAGVYARSDGRIGPFKAPANEELAGVVSLDTDVDSLLQSELNPGGINCLRAMPGRGLRVFGARTLSYEPEWRYVNVRRLFITVLRWIERNLASASFEPNTPRLWVRIQRDLGVYLETLWRLGALKGASAAQAFFVKCDAETNPAEVRELGQVVTEVGLAAVSPSEFVVVRVTQRAGSVQFV